MFWERCQAALAGGAAGELFDTLSTALEQLAVIARACGSRLPASDGALAFKVDEVAAQLIDAATWCVVNGHSEAARAVFDFLDHAVVDPGALAATRVLALCEAGRAEVALSWAANQPEAVQEHEMVRAARLVARLDCGDQDVQRECGLLLATASDESVRRLVDWVQCRAQPKAA
jgi:hypothetical protein